MSEQEQSRLAALLADVLHVVTADALAQRIEQAQRGGRLADARQEAKALADAVDDWLRGEGDQ